MTTELHANPILSEPTTPTGNTAGAIPLSEWRNQIRDQLASSSSDTEESTPPDPISELPHNRRSLEHSTPRLRLEKARTTGDHIQHIHDQTLRRLNSHGGPLPTRKFSFKSDDYGLGELRAPPILPDRERRKSLEHAWTHKPDLPEKSFRQQIYDDIVVGSWIIFSSIWGSLARIGLSALSTYPGQPVFPLIWSQFVGCAVMGFLLQDKTLFPKDDRYVPLYIGLTTGFCGSLTSFSSFIWNCFQALANIDPYYERARGRNILALFAQIIITLCISIAALRFGAHCAQLSRHLLPSVREVTKVKRYLDMIGITLAISGWTAGAIMTALIPKWRSQLFTAVFAPAGTSLLSFWSDVIGALCRWQLSRFNPFAPSFPLGTFTANISATVILGIAVIIQGRSSITSVSTISCAILHGIDTGFCGCLSTISTFAVELDTLIRKHAYVYATVSITLALILLVLVVGIPTWTLGFRAICGL